MEPSAGRVGSRQPLSFSTSLSHEGPSPALSERLFCKHAFTILGSHLFKQMNSVGLALDILGQLFVCLSEMIFWGFNKDSCTNTLGLIFALKPIFPLTTFCCEGLRIRSSFTFKPSKSWQVHISSTF